MPRQFPCERKRAPDRRRSLRAEPDLTTEPGKNDHDVEKLRSDLFGLHLKISNQPRGITRVSTQLKFFHLLLIHDLRNVNVPSSPGLPFQKPTDPLRRGLELYQSRYPMSSELFDSSRSFNLRLAFSTGFAHGMTPMLTDWANEGDYRRFRLRGIPRPLSGQCGPLLRAWMGRGSP